ncbi:MAG: hypothetical protein J0H68_01185 [Sphingobacteriia bacterium]|nr:hypothetical protein [Sphingobacteriia bacterium]
MLKTENQPQKEPLPVLIFPENHFHCELLEGNLNRLSELKDSGYNVLCLEYTQKELEDIINDNPMISNPQWKSNIQKILGTENLLEIVNTFPNNFDTRNLIEQFLTFKKNLLKLAIVRRAKELGFEIKTIDHALTKNYQIEKELYEAFDEKEIKKENVIRYLFSARLSYEREAQMSSEICKLYGENNNIVFMGLGIGHMGMISANLSSANVPHLNILIHSESDKKLYRFASNNYIPSTDKHYENKGFVITKDPISNQNLSFVSLSLEDKININHLILKLVRDYCIYKNKSESQKYSFYIASKGNKEHSVSVEPLDPTKPLFGLENIPNAAKPEGFSLKAAPSLQSILSRIEECAEKNEPKKKNINLYI